MTNQIGSIYGANYQDVLQVAYDRDSDPEGEPLLELTAYPYPDAEFEPVTIRLNSIQARKLRLLIQKYERGVS